MTLLGQFGDMISKSIDAYCMLDTPFSMHAYNVLAAYMRLFTDKGEGLLYTNLLGFRPYCFSSYNQKRQEIVDFMERPPSSRAKRILMRDDKTGVIREFDPSHILESYTYSSLLHLAPRGKDKDPSDKDFLLPIGVMVSQGFSEEEISAILRWAWAEQLHALVNMLRVIQRYYHSVPWDNDVLYNMFTKTNYSAKFNSYYVDSDPSPFRR